MRRSWTRPATNALILRSGRRAPLRRIVVALAALVAGAGCSVPVRQPPAPAQPTIADRVAQYGPGARARLAPYFAAAGIAYPPDQFVLLGFKQERELHLLASGAGRPLVFIRSYPIRGASGGLGPKLREGDRQVPEGIYAVEYLNPNSVAHLSLALSYPNVYDRDRAAEDGRDALGGDIMIHGGSASIGCLAMGDQAAEELFVLANDAGWEDAVVVLSPVDFRRSVLPADYRAPAAWVEYLYFWLRTTLETFPLEPTPTANAAIAVDVP
jgi:L,D-transpeptidase catalytic domain